MQPNLESQAIGTAVQPPVRALFWHVYQPNSRAIPFGTSCRSGMFESPLACDEGLVHVTRV
jgi:hypothetical protein